MTKIVWNWNNFSGGESDTARTGPANSFQNGEAIDIRKTPGEASLAGALIDTGWETLDNITIIENIKQYGGNGIFYASRDGKGYLGGDLKFTLTSDYDEIIGVSYMTSGNVDYLYMFTKTRPNISDLQQGIGKVHRITVDLDSANLEEDYREYIVNNGGGYDGKIPTIPSPARIVFAVGNSVFEITNLEVVNKKITLSNLDEIIGLSVFQNQYRIYSNIQNLNTFQYFWDGISEDFDYKVLWRNLPVRAIENDGGYDTAITGFNQYYSDLYQIAGSQRKEIRVNLESKTGARQFNNHLSSREELVYISGNRNDKDGIYTIGNYYPGMPNALILEYITPDNDTILGHTHDTAASYFACQDDKIYKIDHNHVSPRATTGYLESLIYDGGTGNRFIKKQIDYAYIGFDDVDYIKTIKLYARSDGGSYKLLKTLDSTHSSLRGIRVDRTEFQSVGLGDFFDLEYKAVLAGNGGNTSTARFRGVETYITTGVKK